MKKPNDEYMSYFNNPMKKKNKRNMKIKEIENKRKPPSNKEGKQSLVNLIKNNPKFKKLHKQESPKKVIKKEVKFSTKTVSKFKQSELLGNMLNNKLTHGINGHDKILKNPKNKYQLPNSNKKLLGNMLNNKIKNGVNGHDKIVKNKKKSKQTVKSDDVVIDIVETTNQIKKLQRKTLQKKQKKQKEFTIKKCIFFFCIFLFISVVIGLSITLGIELSSDNSIPNKSNSSNTLFTNIITDTLFPSTTTLLSTSTTTLVPYTTPVYPTNPTNTQTQSPTESSTNTHSPTEPSSNTQTPTEPSSNTQSPTTTTQSPPEPSSNTQSPPEPSSNTQSPTEPSSNTQSPTEPSSNTQSPTEPSSNTQSPTTHTPVTSSNTQSPTTHTPVTSSNTQSPTESSTNKPDIIKLTTIQPTIIDIITTTYYNYTYNNTIDNKNYLSVDMEVHEIKYSLLFVFSTISIIYFIKFINKNQINNLK
mgnify:CR=1 FL=1